MDREALSADAIVLINRIKPHGAEICHKLEFGTMAENIVALATEAMNQLNILYGVAVLENPYHETARIELLLPDEILSRDPDLIPTS